jgi:hypothetical protein
MVSIPLAKEISFFDGNYFELAIAVRKFLLNPPSSVAMVSQILL